MRALILSLACALAAMAGEAAAPLPFPDMAPSVGTLLDQHYYDRSRFRPRLMVERALRALEKAELAIDALWADGRIVLNIKGERAALAAPEPADLPAAMRLIEAVRGAVEARLDAPAPRQRELAYSLVNGLLSTLDPHSVVWPPEAAREWTEDNIQGQFYGIGAFLNQDEGLISIQRVMPGFPAERAGVEDGDIILAIDGEKTAGLTLDQAVRRIKGPKGTTVRLSLGRKGAGQAIEVPIVRDLVKVITIRQVRDGEVGYVRMDEFNVNTAQDLFVALRELERGDGAGEPRPIKALVLDLRFNGGGLLDQAKLIGGFFLGRGQEVVRTTTVDGKEETYSNSARRFVTVPVMVLTSPGTASAAEIVSGALQLNKRAVIAGDTTFGKGSVQNIRELRDGSRLKLTIQEYLLPGGVSIQDVGVEPDLVLLRHGVAKDGTVDLRSRSSERERDNEFALGGRRNYRHEVASKLSWLDPWKDREARRVHTLAARDFRPDREAQIAIDLLKSASAAPDWDAAANAALAAEDLRGFLLERLKAPVAQCAEAEAGAIAAALARLPRQVRWGPPGPAPAASLALSWTGPAEISAGETVALSVQVANTGPTEIGRLFALVRADIRSPLWEEEFVIGAVPAGGTATGTLDFRVPQRLPGGEERFAIELMQDGSDQPLVRTEVALRIRPRPSPHLGLSWRVEDSSGDGRLAPDEPAELVVEVLNEGPGELDKAAVWLAKDNDPFVSLASAREEIAERIPAGGKAERRFGFKVNKEVQRGGQAVPFAAERIRLSLGAAEELADDEDARHRAGVRAAITIPIGVPLRPHRLVQPRITLVGTEAADGRARLDLRIADAADDPATHPLDLVALFQDEDKVDLQAAAALDGPVEGAWRYAPRIDLRPGLNQLLLLVRDADGVVADHEIRLWGPPEAAAAVPAPTP